MPAVAVPVHRLLTSGWMQRYLFSVVVILVDQIQFHQAERWTMIWCSPNQAIASSLGTRVADCQGLLDAHNVHIEFTFSSFQFLLFFVEMMLSMIEMVKMRICNWVFFYQEFMEICVFLSVYLARKLEMRKIFKLCGWVELAHTWNEINLIYHLRLY